ncbi:MAG: mechanosensitive ion channel [Thermoplasmata archaeon]|jgi:small-conductance mechanosensitive channel|nr:mechanosensitive ion channel [Thermoplasmata archaeon]
MKSGLMALMVICLLAVGFLMPFASTDSDAAVDTSDFKIVVSGTEAPDKDVTSVIENGKTKTWDVYVINMSDKFLDVTFSKSSSNSELTITEAPAGKMLVPRNQMNESYYLEGKFTIKADNLSESSHGSLVTLSVTVIDVNDKSSSVNVDVRFLIDIDSVYDNSDMYNKFLGFIENKTPPPFDKAWFPALITVIFWMVIAKFLSWIIAPRFARVLDKQTTSDDQKKFEKILSRLIVSLVMLITINEAMDILGLSASIKNDVMSLSSIICIAITIVIAWEIYKQVIDGVLLRFEESEDDTSIDRTLLPLFLMLGKLGFWAIGIASILGALGIDLQGILISAGVVSLGITMGAQNVLGQFFSGMVILFTRPFKKGDFLKINDKVYVVKKVKVMFTEFYSWDRDQIITMPNNAVTASTIVNLTKEDEAYRLYIYFEVAYQTDIKKAEKVMLDVANKSPLVLHDESHAPPNVRLTSFAGSGIELRLGVTTMNFGSSITDASALRIAVYEAFLENDIEVPYDRLEVTMLNDCFSGQRRPGDTVAD